MTNKKHQSKTGGYIVVETVGVFLPFLLLVISILSLVNIVTLQARVHNALTQTANTLSMYSYVLNATGVADGLMTADSKLASSGESIRAVIDGINALSGGNATGEGVENRAFEAIEEAMGDPKSIIEKLTNYGIGELRGIATEQLVHPFVMRFLATNEMSGEEYLRSVRVINFDLRDCVIIDRNKNVKLAVTYEIEYTFGALRLPFGPTLKVTQTAVTKAWLGGSGGGYW
jgi:hypothetical protein